MTIEKLEEDLRTHFIKKYSDEELKDHNDFFVLQLRGTYKDKSVRFSDLVGNEIPLLEIRAETYQDCFKSLLKSI